jgi:membrane-bound serine protease (ClpP class)
MVVLLLFLAAVGLIYLELFLPGGVFGAIGVFAFFASIFFGFYYYRQAGLWILIGEVIAATAFVLIGLQRFPRSYTGKLFILRRSLETEKEAFKRYIGKRGISLTQLRPAGIAEVDSVRLDVVSDGSFIEQGRRIEVMQVEGNRIVVREIKDVTSQAGG